MDASVSTTLQHTIAYLLNPISSLYSPNTIDSLHNSLLSALSTLTTIPTTTETRLLISPTAPTPPIIARALSALPPQLRVNWADWCLLLSNGNSVALSLKFYPTGRVIATSVDPSNGSSDRFTVYDAAMENNLRNASRIWGNNNHSNNGPAFTSTSRSSAASSASSSDFDLEYSSSSRSSSPDVVAVETAENVLSGIYDDDEEDRISYSKMASAFGGLSLLPTRRPSPSSVPMVGSKSTLSAAAAEWFPRGNFQRAPPPVQPSMSSKRFSLGGAPFVTPVVLPQQQQRSLPTPIGAHRVPGGSHSRSSSRSSTLSHGTAPSLSSTVTSSAQSASPTSPTPSSPTLSDTAGSVELYVDGSKDQQAVTEYECGKVGVLTGAVMLGVPKNSSNSTANRHWKKTHQPGVGIGMVSTGSARRIC